MLLYDAAQRPVGAGFQRRRGLRPAQRRRFLSTMDHGSEDQQE